MGYQLSLSSCQTFYTRGWVMSRLLTRWDICGLIIVGLLLIWQDASADEIVMHVGSKHITDVDYNFNETNSGFGYRHDITGSLSAGGGIYDNSYNNTSVYAGIDLHTSRDKRMGVGIQAGIVTGYEDTPQGAGVVTAFALPYIRAGHGRVFAEVGYLPPVAGISVITFTVGVSWQ